MKLPSLDLSVCLNYYLLGDAKTREDVFAVKTLSHNSLGNT
jgi:hypothetical protein